MRPFLLFLFCSLVFQLSAQKGPMKWGKVSKEHLILNEYEGNPDALVLCDYGVVQFDLGSQLQVYFNHHKRIKILTEAGIEEYGNTSIRHWNHQRISGLKAQVIQPDGSKIAIPKKDVYTEKVSDDFLVEKIAYPQLQVGSIIEIKYQLVSNNFVTLRSWAFQSEIPHLHSELRVEMPSWLRYAELIQGMENISKTVNNNVKSFGTYSVNVENKQFVAQNVPALKKESFISTMDDYKMRIQFQLKAYQPDFGEGETFMSSWNSVANSLREDMDFGNRYKQRRQFSKAADAIDPLLLEVSSDKEKVEVIYNFVNHSINTIEGSHIYSYKNLNEVYEEGEGSIGAQNLLMLALLKEFGFQAHPILLSTRQNGKPYPIHPFMSQFDRMIVAVKIATKVYYLDAGNDYRPMGIPSMQTLNRFGWAIHENEHEWVNITAPKSSDAILFNLTLDEEGAMKGTMEVSSNGYSAVNDRIDCSEKSTKTVWSERLIEHHSDVVVENISTENDNQFNKPYKAKIDLELPSAGMSTGDMIYFTPMLYTSFKENPFKLETRNFPVDIPHPIREQIIINLTIPDGYTLDEIPTPTSFVIPEKGGKFQFLVKQDGNKVQIISKLSINKLYYLPAEYPQIRELFNLFVEKAGEQLVLKKVT